MGLTSAQISAKSMAPLCRQLATAYGAGIPVIRAFEMAGRECGDRRLRAVMRDMTADIKQGATLADAAGAQRKYLPAFFVQLLAAGERGGRLDIMLKDLSDYYEDRVAMQRRIAGMMVYPALQVGAAWFLGTFALGLVGNINLDARNPFNLGDYFQQYLLFQGAAMAVLAVLVAVSIILARMGLFRWVWGWVATFVWPLSPLTRKFALARFFRSLSLLIGSGLDIKRCIQFAAAITVNPYIERDLLQAVPPISQGRTLVEAFSGVNALTPVCREMLEVGETTGDLESSLRKVSQYHFEEANHAVDIATKVLWVAIMLIVGGVIGYVVISFYANLYGGMLDF